MTPIELTELAKTCPFPIHQRPHEGDNKQRGQQDAEAFLAYADGSALGNPGPGGWACIIEYADGSRVQKSGGCVHTTNNRAELQAAIETLMELSVRMRGELRLDSEYVVKGVNEWRAGWQRKGFRNAKGQAVANADLFKTLFELVDERPYVHLTWVRGHNGDPLNELVDTLARAEAMKGKECVR